MHATRINSFARRSTAGRFRHMLTCIVAVAACQIYTASVNAGGMVRVSDGESEYEGKVVALSGTTCSFLDRQGQLLQLNVKTLKSFEKIGPRFRPFATSEMRDALRKEFPASYEVSGTTHYLVCAPNGRAAQYAELFENIYRDVEQFFRVRGFKVHSPDVPLIAVVFKTQTEFVQYCRRDQVPPSPGLMGYYSLKTNRVALFDNANLISSSDTDEHTSDRTISAFAGISSGTADTIIHEATHQVGYNIGIHSRLGGTPIWVVEGLATVLEPAGMRTSSGRHRLEDRINEERVNWFNRQHRPSRAPGYLARLVASDEFFHQQTLNSYSESWAFTFFLLENASRRRNFVTYLQNLGDRDATVQYTAKQRLADFQAAFGDISRLEVEFIRFMDRM